MRRTFLHALLLPCLFSLAPELTPANGGYGPQKVVYHFGADNPQANATGLRNLGNHLNAVPKGQLRAVALVNAGGWKLVAKATAEPGQVEQMRELQARGVIFAVCRNMLREHGLDPATDLVLPMQVVPAGVAELAHLQMQGYAYIKP